MARVATRETVSRATVSELMPSWERHLRAENKAPKILSTYLSSVEAFASFLNAGRKPQQFGAIRRDHTEDRGAEH